MQWSFAGDCGDLEVAWKTEVATALSHNNRRKAGDKPDHQATQRSPRSQAKHPYLTVHHKACSLVMTSGRWLADDDINRWRKSVRLLRREEGMRVAGLIAPVVAGRWA